MLLLRGVFASTLAALPLVSCAQENPIRAVTLGHVVSDRPDDDVGPSRSRPTHWTQVNIVVRTRFLFLINERGAGLMAGIENCDSREHVRFEALYLGNRSLTRLGHLYADDAHNVLGSEEGVTNLSMYIDPRDAAENGGVLCLYLSSGNQVVPKSPIRLELGASN